MEYCCFLIWYSHSKFENGWLHSGYRIRYSNNCPKRSSRSHYSVWISFYHRLCLQPLEVFCKSLYPWFKEIFWEKNRSTNMCLNHSNPACRVMFDIDETIVTTDSTSGWSRDLNGITTLKIVLKMNLTLNNLYKKNYKIPEIKSCLPLYQGQIRGQTTIVRQYTIVGQYFIIRAHT